MNTKPINKALVGEKLTGEFTARHPDQRVTKNNSAYLIFEIKTNLIPIRAIAWKNSCNGLSTIWHGQNIHLVGEWELFHGRWQVRCLSIYYTNRQSQEISLAKTRLRALFSWLPHGNLKIFIDRILNDKSIAIRFSQAPASLRHHHAFPGGLFVHSVDVAWQVFTQQRIPESERYLGAVVGLLHDLGKLRTLTHQMTRTELGTSIGHEQLTLEILSPHLSWLDSQDPQLSFAVRYLLSWKPSGFDRIPKFEVYEYIRAADRVSAGSAVPWSY